MSDAELQLDVLIQSHELVVCRKIVTPDRAVELLAERFHQNLAASTRRDFEDRKQIGAKAPRPELLAVVLVAGLIHVEMTLLGNGIEQFLIRIGETLTYFADEFLDQATAELDANDIAAVFLDFSDRHVTNAFEPADQRCHFWADQTGPPNILGKRAVMGFAAIVTGLSDAAMLGHFDGVVDHFNGLKSFGLLAVITELSAAAGTGLVTMLDDVVDLLIEKRFSLVPFVTGLTADLWFLRST